MEANHILKDMAWFKGSLLEYFFVELVIAPASFLILGVVMYFTLPEPIRNAILPIVMITLFVYYNSVIIID